MRKSIRKIVVDGRQFRWVLPGNALDSAKPVHIVVFGITGGQQLQLDPYAWALEIRPKSIADAIRFALQNGWTPDVKGAPFRIAYQTEGFVVRRRG